MEARYFNSHSPQSDDALLQRIAVGLVIVVLSLCITLVSYAAEPMDQGTARQWEEIAIIRQTAARGHESKAENREGSQEEGVGVAVEYLQVGK